MGQIKPVGRWTKWVNISQSGPTARFAGYYLLIIAECTFFFWFLGLYFNSFLLGIIDCKFSNLHATNSEEKIDNITHFFISSCFFWNYWYLSLYQSPQKIVPCCLIVPLKDCQLRKTKCSIRHSWLMTGRYYSKLY